MAIPSWFAEVAANAEAAELIDPRHLRRDALRLVERPRVLKERSADPELGPEPVLRRRLIERLDAAAKRKLTLIRAGEGFGKTTLIEQWAARSRAPAVIIPLDERDNDPVRFLATLAGALGALGGPRRANALLTAVLRLLAPAQSVILVFDGYDAIHAEAVHRTVATLLERTSPAVRLLISSRTDAPVPLGRLRVRGEVSSIKQADLCFTAAEAASLLAAAGAPPLAARDVQALVTATGGWVSGLELAALALRSEVAGAGGGLLRALAAREVVIVEEVLRLQDEATRAFLLATSILEVRTAAACDAVTGGTDGEPRLRALAAAGVLRKLPAADERRSGARKPEPPSYRAHRALDEHLRALLEQREPERFAALHARAAAFFARGVASAPGARRPACWEGAFRHALAGREPELAADLLVARGQTALELGEIEGLLADLDALPEPARRRPLLDALRDEALALRAAGADCPHEPAGSPTETAATVLSDREREVMDLLTAGYSCREIAERLTVSFETVRTHCRRIFRKLGVRDREEAVQRAASLPARSA